jgi:CBS domain-containing protein
MIVSHILDEKGREVATTRPHLPLSEVVRQLGEKRIGALVVAGADGVILGIISERDVVRALANSGAGALDEPVSRHMTAKVVTASPDDHIDSVMEWMTTGRFRHMPVEQDGKLAGIVSIGDVVKMRLNELSSETQALRDYITTS